MSRQGPRGLGQKDFDLWEKVKASATPLHPGKSAAIAPASKKPPPRPIRVEAQKVPKFRIGEKSVETNSPPASRPEVITMDRSDYERLKRGKLKPEARLDLHGMTLAIAKPEVERFIFSAYKKGLRNLLVITGKGKHQEDYGPIPVRPGQLRHHLPQWLREPSLSSIVLQTLEAHPKHGGAGARYVYLRRKR